jgi:hypothetical protein
MTTLPFEKRIKQRRNILQVIGILTVAADGIFVEWRIDRYERRRFGFRHHHVERGDLKSWLVPWGQIDAVSYHGRILRGGQIRIRGRSMDALDRLPGAHGPFWWARIGTLERSRAREFTLAADSVISATVELLGGRKDTPRQLR